MGPSGSTGFFIRLFTYESFESPGFLDKAGAIDLEGPHRFRIGLRPGRLLGRRTIWAYGQVDQMAIVPQFPSC